MDQFVPALFVASAVPYGTQDPVEVAYHCAAGALDDENVSLITSIADGLVYFIATPSKELIDHPQASTALAAGLPGMPGHQGDGAYMAEIGNGGLYGLIVRQKNTLKSLAGTSQEIKQYVEALNVPLIHLELEPPQPWEGYRLRAMHQARKLTEKGVYFGIGILALNVMMIIVLAFTQGFLTRGDRSAQQEITTHLHQAADAVANANQQPVLAALNSFQRVSSLVMNAGGHIQYYKLDKGKVSFSLELPKGLPEQRLAALGQPLKIDDSPDHQHLIVQKNSDSAGHQVNAMQNRAKH